MKPERSARWWAGLTEPERYMLEYLELGDRKSSGYDGRESDDKIKHVCVACGISVYRHTGLCSLCFQEMLWLIAKANKAYCGEMIPPWAEFPEYAPDCTGWHIGVGEDYVNEWFSFYDALTEDVKTEYQQKYPAPQGYDDLYSVAVLVDLFDRIPKYYDPIAYNLQMIRYHREQTLAISRTTE